MKEFIESNRSGWNKFVASSFGIQFCEGMLRMQEDKEKVIERYGERMRESDREIWGENARK